MENLKIISAGAGSGKTFRLTAEMVQLLKQGVRPSGIIATTFTKKAAAELEERVRVKLLEEDLSAEADELSNALIGTVHGLGVKLLRRFSFEAGVSPEVDIVAEEDQQIMFNQSLATVLTQERIKQMELYSDRLGLHKREHYDWRREVKSLTDLARSNDFPLSVLEESKVKSFDSFAVFLGPLSHKSSADFNEELLQHLNRSLEELEANEDSTLKTQKAVNVLKALRNKLQLKGELNWHEWVKIGKIGVGAKSKDAVVDLVECAWQHQGHPDFRNDIQQFMNGIFSIAIEALSEYDQYKKRRGLIDYIDMEIQVKRLLDHPQVREALSAELDLLMVDEFQDTNPIQLEIFLKLCDLAKHAVWVGDPKQSIYGFRGAEPRLMQEIIRICGGVKEEDIQSHSWRSREDIVNATNALFTKAFSQLPVEQIALKAKRTKLATADSKNEEDEPLRMGDALMHWHFDYDGEGKRLPGKPWMENCIATAIKQLLDRDTWIFPKEEKKYRAALPGDIAVLCRSNKDCQIVAEALHRVGLQAAISRSGLLSTAEAKLLLACLKFTLNESDSLSVAEILLLADGQKIEDIIENRLEFLAHAEDQYAELDWAKENPIIGQLDKLRKRVVEMSSTEILNLILTELDLNRIIASWGNLRQRMDNVDVLRKLALQYEEACNRLHTAASLGGFLLWLNELERNETDMQGSGEGKDAVNVLTYHRSKGLEWPVVICHSLENALRESIWGLNIIAETEEVDIKNILGGRWLRYWINPYADQYRNTPLAERINESEWRKQARVQALQEEARLLYVGITRARDYLIFPTRQNPAKWLNRVWHQGEEAQPTLDAHSPETPWEWEGEFLIKATEVMPFPRDFGHAEIAYKKLSYFEAQAGEEWFPPFEIDLHKEGFKAELSIRIGKVQNYGPGLISEDVANPYQLAKVAKAFLTADHQSYPLEKRLQMAEDFLPRYEVEEALAAKVLLQLSEAFYNYLTAQFTGKKVYRKYPIRYFREGRLFQTIIDLIIESDADLIIIQNSGFAGEQKKWRSKAQELTDWVHLSKSALQEIFQKDEVKTYVHFVLGASLIELETTEQIRENSLRITKTARH